jgi:hypothetical protein
MWPQEPGSFTRIIPAMVAPRNTSSETIRAGRAAPAGAGVLDTGATIVSAVAMGRPSNGGDSTAARIMPQRRNGERAHKKTWPGEGIPAKLFCQREEIFAIPGYGMRVSSSDRPNCARRRKWN